MPEQGRPGPRSMDQHQALPVPQMNALTAPSRRLRCHRGCLLMSPNWLGGLHRAWRGLVDWFARTPVSHGSTASTGRQPESADWMRVESTAAGPGSGAALEGAPAALPPIVPPVDPPPAATTDFHGHSHRSVDPKPPPATRQRVVQLPHAPTHATDTPTQTPHRWPVTGRDSRDLACGQVIVSMLSSSTRRSMPQPSSASMMTSMAPPMPRTRWYTV